MIPFLGDPIGEHVVSLIGERDALRKLLADAGPNGCVTADAVRTSLGVQRRPGPARIYVASPLTEAPIACLIADALRERGYQPTSTWHFDVQAGRDPCAMHGRQESLRINLQDMARADMCVAWTATGRGRGTYGEIGRMLAQGKPVVWIQGEGGEGSSIDDADPGVVIVRSCAEVDVMGAVERVAKQRGWR